MAVITDLQGRTFSTNEWGIDEVVSMALETGSNGMKSKEAVAEYRRKAAQAAEKAVEYTNLNEGESAMEAILASKIYFRIASGISRDKKDIEVSTHNLAEYVKERKRRKERTTAPILKLDLT